MIKSQMWSLKKDKTVIKAAAAIHLHKYSLFLNDFVNNCLCECTTLENITEGPIRLVYRSDEHVKLISISDTKNKFYSKLLACIISTCTEIQILKAEAEKFYRTLINNDEKCNNEVDYKIENLFLDLQNLSIFVNRIHSVVYLTIQQLSNLIRNSHREIYLPFFIEYMIDLFVILVTLDAVISTQPSIINCWKGFRNKVESSFNDLLKLNIPKEKISTFKKLLKDLQNQLFSKTLFLKSIEQIIDVNKSRVLIDQMTYFLKNILSDLENKINDKVFVNKKLIQGNLGVVVMFKLFGACDKKLLKKLVKANKRLYAVILITNVVWVPQDFLIKCLPGEGLSSIPNYIGEKLLLGEVQRLPLIVDNLVQKAVLWCIKIKGLLIKTGFQIFSEIEHKRNLLLEVLGLICQMHENSSYVTNLHGFLLKPMKRSTVQLICRLVEAQKALEISFYTYGLNVVLAQSQVLQQLSYQILVTLESLRKYWGHIKVGGATGGNNVNINSSNNSIDIHDHTYNKSISYSREHLDAMLLVGSSTRLLNSTPSPERRLVLRCALICACQLTEYFREDDFTRLSFLLDTCDTIVDLFARIKKACNYSLLLHQESILPAYLSLTTETEIGAFGHVNNFFQACTSAITTYQFAKIINKTGIIEKYNTIRQCFLEPACREVETELRLHVHSYLRLYCGRSFQWATVPVSPLLISLSLPTPESIVSSKTLAAGARLVRAGPMFVSSGRILSGQRYIEHYLHKTFYNLMSVALHDWYVYRGMDTLAHYRYGFESVPEQLPTQTFEQGLDALELMRNIEVFVTRYLYNLHTQTFVERISAGRHFNTIGIQHVANSVRTHGTGIMSTSVNFVYQFLRVKLHLLSQFLFDEHIKSRLSRDVNFVRAQKERIALAYCYERAEKFQRSIRKLGVTSEGLSYLDQFRQLITQIGNALGYVRLIRSAGLHASANAVFFLPPDADIVNINDESFLDNYEHLYSKSVQTAASRLEIDLADLVRNFSEDIHYFRLLVDVFAPAFRDADKCQHLQQFYAIVPPLTLSFVDNAVTNKEKLFKKNNTGGAFSDDGFAMGLAYVNALLGQSKELDSLNWFKIVQQYLVSQMTVAEKKAENEDEKFQQTRVLTLKRLKERSSEFQLLYYSLSGARVFFRRSESFVR